MLSGGDAALDEKNELLLNFILELRRGTLVLSVLSRMAEPKYGYALVQSLEKEGMRIDANTLYPLLRRLEKQGLLESVWETRGAKPRKYYRRTALGEEIYTALCEQWHQMTQSMDALLGEEEQWG